ncbi:MAG TPA: nucleoside-diphosphate sugar epimerase/dehydratase [Tepidisphaeraceae bacterium]|jgi:FlaA1/EpsC-like NDP-sugar epimerase|nr:nucleoside-diphosphate sugar epimerase/dehydratase [Tepidisphaeraceae bacterium]
MLLTALRNLFSVPSVPSVVNPPEISIDALLRRPAVNLDTPELQRFLAGKTILVTGAGGSIGSEICRQILRFCPAQLLLVEQAENALFEIHQELSQRWVGSPLTPIVADITDSIRINQIFAQHRPQVIFHCAAHKHVPMMELNPGEAIKNNVLGTKTVADAASAHHAHSFVLISTDKAVNPTSVMGAAKRCAELYVQSLTNRSRTRFVAVRFGNVLGSSGSVVPTFKKQIAAGGPVTVTHPDMKRYFMTIPEASQLVLQAGAIADGGEIFILDMGDPIKILTLAEDLIRQSGLTPHKDIAIEFTGIRPGEKLYEELAASSDQTLPTKHEKIRTWQLPVATPAQIDHMLSTLTPVLNAPRQHVIDALCQIVPEYTPNGIKQPVPQLRLVA